MIKKRKFTNNSLWWIDFTLLNTGNTKFLYNKESNIFTLNIDKKFYFFYFVLTKYSLNILKFFNLDCTFLDKSTNIKNLYIIATQTIFCDYKALVTVYTDKHIDSLSTIYNGNTWVERELREFYQIFFTNLYDSRKLLSNYNYNTELSYNHFNSIVYDMSI
jgi:NADH:ubiquinone oxidoreductase subunit C